MDMAGVLEQIRGIIGDEKLAPPEAGRWITWTSLEDDEEFVAEVISHHDELGSLIKNPKNFSKNAEMRVKVRHVNGIQYYIDQDALAVGGWKYEKKPSNELINKSKACSFNRIMGDLKCASCSDVTRLLQNCEGCHKVYYCNSTCQLAHWPEHRKVCRRTVTVLRPHPRYPLPRRSMKMAEEQFLIQDEASKTLQDALAGRFSVVQPKKVPDVVKQGFQAKGQPLEIVLEFGHKSSLLSSKDVVPLISSHKFEVWVKSPSGDKIEHFIERVVFHLLDGPPVPKRTVTNPPYCMKEVIWTDGHCSYKMNIDVFFKAPTDDSLRKKRIFYEIDMQPYKRPKEKEYMKVMNKTRPEKLRFNTFDKDFRKKLLKGGAKLVEPTEEEAIAGGEVIVDCYKNLVPEERYNVKVRSNLKNKGLSMRWLGVEDSDHSIPKGKLTSCSFLRCVEGFEKELKGGLHFIASDENAALFWVMMINFNTYGTIALHHSPCQCNDSDQMPPQWRKLRRRLDKMLARAKADRTDVQCMFADTKDGCHNFPNCPFKHQKEVTKRRRTEKK